VASPQKRFFFRHIEEDGSCAAQSRGMHPDEILARKYHGQRESAAHKRIKNLIERSLKADASFSTVAIEKTWRAARDPKARRQPDVQAVRGDLRIAFEVQLSTTFLSVVAGRRQFYRMEGGLLIWVLASFTQEYRRMTTDDLLFSNNSNLLVVDEETTAISERDGVFYVRCHFRMPVRNGYEISDAWEERIIRFDALTLELERQRAYFIDFEGARQKLEGLIEAEQIAEAQRYDDALREAFWHFWQLRQQGTDYANAEADWLYLRNEFEGRGISVPFEYYETWNLQTVLNALLSAKAGRPIGWKYASIVQVAHLLEDKHKAILLIFGYALAAYGHRKKLETEDTTGRWNRKRASVREKIATYDPEFIPDGQWVDLIEFLFPGIGTKIEAYIARARKNNTDIIKRLESSVAAQSDW
jgi:hypothetical protein